MRYVITENKRIAPDVYRLHMEGDASSITRPGQFMQVEVPGFYLRRPISICDWTENSVTLVYKVVGDGTARMATYGPGVELDALPALGNGFDPSVECERPLLVGGGVGTPPLYGLCKALIAIGKKPQVVLGFNRAEEIFLADDFRALGCDVYVTTVDGSCGIKGFVTAAMEGLDYDYFFTCGPEPMLKAVYNAASCSGQLSFEERMACGFGACMGCSCQTKYGTKRICKDGPVLVKEEVIW